MQLSNYSEEYVKEQMDDFNEFISVVHNVYGCGIGKKYSMQMLATLYTVMKREIPRENSGYSGY